jgi:hypothetical protein
LSRPPVIVAPLTKFRVFGRGLDRFYRVEPWQFREKSPR